MEVCLHCRNVAAPNDENKDDGCDSPPAERHVRTYSTPKKGGHKRKYGKNSPASKVRSPVKKRPNLDSSLDSIDAYMDRR